MPDTKQERIAWSPIVFDITEQTSFDLDKLLAGAGMGIVTITLAVLRSTLDPSDQPGSIVTADLHSVTSNHVLMNKCVPQTAVLDWEHEKLPPPVQAKLEVGLDVIGCHLQHSVLSRSHRNALVAHPVLQTQTERTSPRVLMGYKERHPDERSLWDRAKGTDLYFQQVAHVNGAGGDPVEIWLG
ncbi:hypothetical protein J3R83DRAFT_5461 [Lanmaoa asiatica]|nr:hypothetical protein J3R83DRAFT_5461 [Lanmaoa asiatica]